ncbi:asparaginyl-tRNA synthetase-like isoform X2 [Apostichopus japonicus]|uniref:asparaginyl-tRNA synthetase-like isoform X2 n=1 Tax=Stichopus japonicus TaxID=307972 RepID=UPI003AB36FCD
MIGVKVQNLCRAARRFSSNVSIKDIVRYGIRKCEGNQGINGWIRGIRKYKDVTFLDVNDGSSIKNLQVVAATNTVPTDVTFGSSVHIQGKLKERDAVQQKFEMQATAIEVIGTCDNSTYPLKHKTRHTMEYTRQYLHLRSRTNAFGALLRIRHAVTVGFHKFFTEEGFLNVQTPVLTSNDCEGAGDLFKVTPDDESLSETTEGFFDKDAYLTVSGQLHLEIVCCSHGRVYTFNPAFRAENSRSRRHLAEFSMVEAELPFTRDITDLTKCMESMLRTVTDEVYTQSNDDVQLFNDRIAKGHRWGADLQSEHEKYIVMHCGNRPVFVIDYPQSLKAFYALSNDDKNETVAAVDLLVPGVGELIGGSLREHRLHLLKHKLASLGLEKEYQWYLDLRSFGSIPHGGFGLGFERYLLFLLGVDNIRDVIPFPRFSHSCVL